MNNNLNYLLVKLSLVFSTLLIVISGSDASQLFYTIQLGSFHKIAPAQKQFNAVQRLLNEDDLAYLRIEKVGKYYSVRLGKFKHRSGAEKLLGTVKSSMPSVIILKAYYIKERISAIYKIPRPAVTGQSEKKPSADSVVKKVRTAVTKKTGQKIGEYHEAESLEEKIKIISGLVTKKDYENAINIIRANLNVQPDIPELNGWCGAVLLKLNRPEEALEYFKKATNLAPDLPDYHNGMGYCLFYLNRFSEAADEFKKAIYSDPEHIDALAGLGITYIKINENKKAFTVYKKLKNLDAAAADKLFNLISEYHN